MKSAPNHDSKGLHVSDDGYVRVPLPAVGTLRFVHFLSGLDDDTPGCCMEGGCSTSISGYTEWLTDTDPVITIGWDWHLDPTTVTPMYVRDGLPRTNMMALDSASYEDLGDLQTGTLLAALIDGFGWQNVVFEYIGTRYA